MAWFIVGVSLALPLGLVLGAVLHGKHCEMWRMRAIEQLSDEVFGALLSLTNRASSEASETASIIHDFTERVAHLAGSIHLSWPDGAGSGQKET